MEQGGLEDGGQGQLEIARCDVGMPVFLRDDLALFGHLEVAVDGPVRLGEDGGVGRPASPADGPAPAMEQPQVDPVIDRDVSHHPLRLVDLPLTGRDPADLVGVGVAEHDLLGVAPESDQLSVLRVAEQPVEEGAGVRQVVDGLHQRDEADRHNTASQVHQPCFSGENSCFEDVGRGLGHGDDVALDDLLPITGLGFGNRPEAAQGVGSLFAEGGGRSGERPRAGELFTEQSSPVVRGEAGVVGVGERVELGQGGPVLGQSAP